MSPVGNYLYDNLIAPHSGHQACFFKRDAAPELSFDEFAALTARLAHALSDHGLMPGDRVVVQAAKSVEMVALYVATVQAGGVFVPLNTAYTREEVAYFVGDAAPRIIVCDGQSVETISELASGEDATVLTLNADGSGTLTQSLADRPATFATVPRGPDDLAALLYTSGTTGRSKGAMLTHNNLLSNAMTLVDHWRITQGDTLIHALPVFHTHGLFVALNTSLLAGAKVHFMPAFDPDAIFAAFPSSTMLMGVPTFYTRLLADDRLTRDVTSNMRVFISGSAPLLAETHTAFTARTGHQILERYGMTETNMITSNPYEGDRRAGTVGQPLPGVEIRLTDPDSSTETKKGAVGMIEVRGPNVFKGYWQMPDKTAAELREDGFFVTGDLGQMGNDGYLTIVGRAKDLIITGGYNVYPKEIEEVLNDIDGVNESAVFGVPHDEYGETVVAVIVPEAGKDINADTLTDVVSDKLARYKHPRRYEILAALPRNTMGKVQKNVLREMFREN